MAANQIQIKRTSVAGRTPNTTNSSNGQYIAAGELAINLSDGILYTSNGSTLINLTGTGGGGGGASVTISDTPPGGATANSLWWSSSLSKMFIYYNDGDTLQWVEDSTNFSGFDATDDLDTGGATSEYFNRLVDGGAA